MKKTLLSAFALGVAISVSAQCDKLFISEYVVGSGNDKAYEIYNPTDQPWDLTGIKMERFSNGQNASTDETILQGTIPPYGTWVVTNGQTEDIDLGTYISPRCSPELQALADQLDAPYPAPTFMNGNDALVLIEYPESGPPIVYDIFGKPGEDPGIAWSAPDGTFITNSQTMVRKFEITQGVTIPPIEFLPLLEYDTLGINNWTNLGIHECACNPVSTRDKSALDVKLYPNPAVSGGEINVETNRPIQGVEVFDLNGKIVRSEFLPTDATRGIITLDNLARGTYVVNVLMDRTGFSTQIIVE